MFSRLTSMLGGGVGALPFVVTDPESPPRKLGSESIWSHSEGTSKADGSPVSIFFFDVTSSSADQLDAARNAIRRMKTLRHPSFLRYIDSVETDKSIQVVTERVIPLAERLQEDKNMLAISWGLHQVAKAIGFLVDSQMTHCNICLSSIVVDMTGEWKLGGLELLRRETDDAGSVVKMPTPVKYQPPEKKGAIRKGHSWSDDMWGFGCLIWEVFNGELPRPERLTDVDNIPKKLLEPFVKLIGANPKSRPSPQNFIAEARNNGRYLDNDFVNSTFFLEEINLKSSEEVSAFYKGLPALLDGFPRDACIRKILPQLLQAFNYGGAGSAVLGPLFKIGSYLDADEYRDKIVPCVIKLFSSTDRATRISLLRSLHLFIEHLTESLVSEKIFPQLATGFTDSVPAMREETVKAMLLVVPKLSNTIVDNQLLRFFAKLQMDEAPSIRVNTTICLGKIAPYLTPESRDRVLASAFVRCLKDNFSHARAAGLMAIKATQNFFSTTDLVRKVFLGVVGLTLDPDEAVKTQALNLARGMLDRIENGPAEADMTVAAVSSAMKNNSSSWAWASSAVTSVISKTVLKASAVGGAGNPSGRAGPASPTDSGKGVPDRHDADDDDDFEDAQSGPSLETPPKQRKTPPKKSPSSRLQLQVDADDGGWGDDDDDDKSDYGDKSGWGGGDADTWGNDDGWGNDSADDLDLDQQSHGAPSSRSSEPVTIAPRTASHSTSKPADSKPRSGGIKLGKKKVGGGLGARKPSKAD